MGYGAGITNILTEIKLIKQLTNEHSFQLVSIENLNVVELSLKALQLGVKVRLSPSDKQLINIIEASDLLVFHYWNCPSSYEFIKKIKSFSIGLRLCISLRVNGNTLPQIPPEWLLSAANGIIQVHPKTNLNKYKYLNPIILPSLVEIPKWEGVLKPKNSDPFKMLYAGAFTPFKAHPLFFDLHYNLAIKNYQLDIYGNMMPEKYNSINQISFKGFTTKLNEQILSYHMLCNPQHRLAYSSFDKIMKECQLLGVPPIVLKESSVGDLIENNVNGIIAEDILDYKMKLEEMANNHYYYLKIQQSTFENTHATYNPFKIVNDTFVYYQCLVQTKNKVAITNKIPLEAYEACLDGMGDKKISLINNPNDLTKDEKLFALNCEGGLAQFGNYYPSNKYLEEIIMQLD
jgi:hypothetical protein